MLGAPQRCCHCSSSGQGRLYGRSSSTSSSTTKVTSTSWAPRHGRSSSSARPSAAAQHRQPVAAGDDAGQQQQMQQQQQQGRRALLAGGVLAAVGAPLLAAAGPAAAANAYTEWWKSRRTANGGAKLLNPLYVAQQRLQEARDVLQQGGGDSALAAEDVTAALQLVRASSLNCYIFEPLVDDTIETKASLLTQKLELSDPCTFRIVLKNTVDLEPADVQEAALQKMDALVLSYQHLDSLLEMAREGNAEALPRALEQIKTTQTIAADIEAFVKQTLGV